jgi:hypothetical protein
VVIHIVALPTDAALAPLGTPSSNFTSVGQFVYDVKAMLDNTTVLDSFDEPLTISYLFSADAVDEADLSRLWLYHYHGGEWLPLDNCTVNESLHYISCDTQSFSMFALFASSTPAQAQSDDSSGAGAGGALPWCSGPSAPGWNTSLPDGGCGGSASLAAAAVTSLGIASNGPALCPAYRFTRTLRFGMTGEDVRALQRFLNCAGFSLGANGPGSAGHETSNFVNRTLASVRAFQNAYASRVLTPLGLDAPTGIFAQYSQTQAYALMRTE